ncbi:hypothetical protein JCGZ_16649 [Jatropha curcas]|uniref:VQ domain-containing protein n=1 Tax=Jatropha curcas TaxID=180498 RepID=A0A067KAI5_JATCU|nr:uncharacterized protein LOC105642361 [Jatropha curcas]KDP29260.1 hypothetical protein JCGZ_16649 [Jatropha curcas]
MDSLMVATTATVQENKKRAPKRIKKVKKQPMKVVYITNPIKFKTSASQFRALVQELTGQDSELPADPTSWFLDRYHHDGDNLTDPDASRNNDDDDRALVEVVPTLDFKDHEQLERVVLDPDAPPLELFDDIFIPQILESCSSSGLMTSSLFYESSAAASATTTTTHVDLLRTLN